jgi:hypothetical protein
MHKNTFLTTPDVKKHFFTDLILVVLKCIKTHFLPRQTLKNIFFETMILVVWKYSQKHRNTFLTTPGEKKTFLRN